MSSSYTDGGYLNRHPTWHAEDSPWKAAQILKMLQLEGLLPRSIVEIGCGAGAIVRKLHEHFPDTTFTAYDISSDAIALAETQSNKDVTFRVGDGLSEAHRFDLLLAIDVLEHVEDCFGWLRTLRSKAEWAMFHIPLDLSLLSVARPTVLPRVRRSVGHIHSFTKETALSLLEDTGFTPKRSFITAGCIDLRPKGIKSRIGWLPRWFAYALSPAIAARWLSGFSLMVLCRTNT